MSYAFVALSFALYVAGSALIGEFEPIDALYGAMLLTFGVTGAVIRRRRPANPIGPLFLGISVAAALAELSHAIADQTGFALAATYASASWIPLMLPGLTFLLLLFPDGKPLSPRWRSVVWCAAAGLVLQFAAALLRPGPLEDYPEIVNPLGLGVAEPLEALSWLVLVVVLIGAPLSLILRMRRAVGVERQQIKWLAFAGAFAATAMIVGAPLQLSTLPEAPVYVVMMTGVLSLPVAAAVAIVRYRLYNIDVVVNRTLVYVTLTAILAGVYVGGVLLLQLILSPSSDLAIAGSTLAVAALFRPLRARVQAVVDRRFFRRRYDAQATLQAFAARLRDQVSLDAVEAELRASVVGTMQPTHVGLWLRSEA